MIKEVLICSLFMAAVISAAGIRKRDVSSEVDESAADFSSLIKDISTGSIDASHIAQRSKRSDRPSKKIDDDMEYTYPVREEELDEKNPGMNEDKEEEEEEEKENTQNWTQYVWIAVPATIILFIGYCLKKQISKYCFKQQVNSAPLPESTQKGDQISGTIDNADSVNVDLRNNHDDISTHPQAGDNPPEYSTVISEAPSGGKPAHMIKGK